MNSCLSVDLSSRSRYSSSVQRTGMRLSAALMPQDSPAGEEVPGGSGWPSMEATDEERWLYFLKNGHQMTPEEIEEIAMPEIRSAEEKLRVISQDRLLRVQHEQRQKAERDAIAW